MPTSGTAPSSPRRSAGSPACTPIRTSGITPGLPARSPPAPSRACPTETGLLAEGGVGAREGGGEGVARGAVQVPGELHRAAGLVAGDALHGQQGRAAGLVEYAGLRGRGVLGAHPLGR